MNTSVANLVNSVTGNVAKGYIMLKNKTIMPEEPGASRSGASANKSKFAQAMGSASSALNAAKTALSVVSGGTGAQIASEHYDTIEVQYNPSSITMNTIRGRILNRSVGGAGENAYQQYDVAARTTMTVELVFDSTNIYDAFNMENVTSLSGAKTLGKQMYTGLTDGEYSVRPYVEAFVGAMNREETKNVIFAWNHMAFRGELTGVSAQYTMFNRTGEPIRAKVGLEIFQENTVDQASQEYTDEYWREAYNNLFEGTLSGGAMQARSKNIAKNFLNLDF